ncbi:hypothetical protein O6H91_11G065000 [Diphasiastrum complanatum]|uniref:Uncharacterized protein n=1 Tax=Diphasiastrum complanatum TaxID=34168 RepID=A0ACC2CAC9_DIPCM|nr:hypothetical protein O6H91_11G065000 [Diphasiastrum complanatum]
MKNIQLHTFSADMERKWLLPLIASCLVSISLFLLATLSIGASSDNKAQASLFQLFSSTQMESPSEMYGDSNLAEVPSLEPPSPPSLAYLISGTKGDGNRMKRTLQALYHPRNHYVLHLDLEAPPRERVELARYVRMEPTFREVGNVHVVGKANLVTYRGPTMVACTLHAAAILLRRSKDWDWFINLSASDYPLVTQDGHSLILLLQLFLF